MVAEPLVLAIDTSSSVAVGLARGGQPLAAESIEDPMVHAERLAPLVRSVCGRAGVTVGDLDLLVVGLGPGPFTGLRVGVVTARMFSAVLDIGLHGVCSLDVLAAQHTERAGQFVVATDARRREVYWARYGADGLRIGDAQVGAAESVPRLPTVGPAVLLYPDRLDAVDGPRSLDPSVLAAVGASLPSAGVQPLYLRRPDASPPTRPKSVLVRRPGTR